MLRASIDLGTNTCLMLIADWDSVTNKIKSVVADFCQIVRLGEGVDKNREFQAIPMQRVNNCLKQYLEHLKKYRIPPGEVICVATSQARDARNSSAFFTEIESRLGFKFEILSGREEAKVTFLGSLLPGMQFKRSVVIDIGGGSTEIITHAKRTSLDIGSVRLTERYLKSNPVSDEEFWACQAFIDQSLQGVVEKRGRFLQKKQCLAVAGTATTLAAWHHNLTKFDARKIDETVLTRGEVHRLMEELKWRTVEERTLLPMMDPLRADVILAGTMILWRIMELFQFKECRVSTRGLRFGALYPDDVTLVKIAKKKTRKGRLSDK